MLIVRMNYSLVHQEKLLTVHKSQGREWDTVIVSLADEPPGYYTNSNLENGLHVLNTALSRAKKKLILVGDLTKWRNQPRQMIAEIIKIIEAQANQMNATEVKTSSGLATALDNKGQPWTSAADEELIRLYQTGLMIPALAQHFGRTTGAIQARLKKLGVI